MSDATKTEPEAWDAVIVTCRAADDARRAVIAARDALAAAELAAADAREAAAAALREHARIAAGRLGA